MVIFDALVAGHIRRRGLRALVTVFAVSLGVAVFTGLGVASERAIASFGAQTGAVGDTGDFSVVATAGSLDGSLLARVRSTAGLSSAMPVVVGDAVIDGEVVRVEGRDLLAPLPAAYEFRRVLPGPFAPIGSGPDPGLLIRGRGVLLAARFAAERHLRVGDVVVAQEGPSRYPLTIAALVPDRYVLDAGTAIVDVATAQELFALGSRFDRIECTALDVARARAAVARILPPGAGLVSAGERRAQLEHMVAGLRFDLSAAGILALALAIVLVSDSIAISVLQRREEIATLRAFGATRAAIARAFVAEGALVGTLGGLFGTVAGLALADRVRIGAAPGGGDDGTTPFVAFAAGIVLGVLGALGPALEAAAVLPARVSAAPPRVDRSRGVRVRALASSAACAFLGALAFVAVLWNAAETATPLAGAVACVAFVSATLLLSPTLLARSAAALRRATLEAPPPVRLAVGYLRSGSRRLSVSIASLTIGVALGAGLVTFAASFRTSIVAWSATAFRGDLVVRPLEGSAAAPAARFTPQAVARVAALPGVASVDATRTLEVPFAGGLVAVSPDAATGSDSRRPDARSADRSRAADAIPATIDTTIATRARLRTGDTFSLPVADGSATLLVARIVDASPVAGGSIVLPRASFVRAYRDDTADALTIGARAKNDIDGLRRSLRAALAPRALDLQTTRALRTRLLARFDPIVAAAFALAALALAMGALGIVTTMSALVLERRDDIRLLRFAGLSSGGVRTMVVFEAAVVGALGGAAGVALGVVLALTILAVDRVAFGWTLVTSIPLLALVGTFAATVAAGVLAGLGPGRFAARLRIERGARAFVSTALVVVFIAGASSRSGAARATETVSPNAFATFAASGDARDVWHVLGRLHAPDGSRYDVSATFFRYSLDVPASNVTLASVDAHASPTTASAFPPSRASTMTTSPWASRAFDAAALSIVNEDARTTVTATRVEREGTGFAHAARALLDLRVDDWTLRTNDRRANALRLHVAEGTNDVNLSLERRVLPIAIGCAGRLANGVADPHSSTCATADSRLAARGTITLGDRRIAVRGTFWLDHESATSAEATTSTARTERFTIQLDDGRVLFLRAVPGSTVARGIFVSRTGVVGRLGAGDADIWNPLATSWRNAHGVPYPSLFEAVVPRAHLDLALVPVVQSQEIDPTPRGRAFYSGALDVERAGPGPRDSGTGFVELTGFADDPGP